MNDNEIERALSALKEQRLKAPSALMENMVKTARRLEAERSRQNPVIGGAAERSVGLSSPKSKKDKGKTM